MIRPRKVRTVALFEFHSMVTRKGFLIATFGMPVFLLLYGGLISLAGYSAEKKESEVKVYGVVDRAGVLSLDAPVEGGAIEIPDEIKSALERAGRTGALDRALAWWGNIVFRPYDDEQAARQALRDGTIKGYHLVPEDYVESGRVDMYTGEKADLSDSDSRRSLGNLLLGRLLEGRVAGPIAERVRNPIAESTQWTITADGTIEQRSKIAKFANLIVPIVFGVLLLISLMSSAGYLLQGTSTEKENRVVEVLLSSAEPDEILAGKLIGLGATGLLQVVVWFGMIVVGGFGFASTLQLAGVDMPWAGLAGAVPFFVAGYLFTGSLMLGLGSLGGNQRESQQFAMICALPSAVPLVFMASFLTDPNGTIARLLTWIPFTAPVTAVLRMTLEPNPLVWLEVAGAFLVLVTCTWFALRFGARLFRVGLLLTGTRPKLREILRQARLSSR